MRIISPFKDYYDSAQAYGMDDFLTYQRDCKKVNIDLHRQIGLADFEPIWNCIDDLHLITLVFFCGKMHTFLNRGTSFTPVALSALRSEVGYLSVESLAKQFPTLNRELKNLTGIPVGDKLHIALQSPIVVFEFDYQSSRFNSNKVTDVITNPRLANFGFQSILDPFTCFQEIAQYLGNELAQPDIAPLRTGDDETIARAKGFDEQSFRTAVPGNKKINRKANRARKKKSE